ncbi:MAG: STAS domain-containing protein [Syntrophales bacterium]
MALNALNRSTGFIAVGGLLRAESEGDLRNAAADAVKRGIKNIVLDFRPIDHMNSAGASVLAKLAATAKRQQLHFFAFGLNSRYREILTLTGLSEGIVVLDETAAAPDPLSADDLRQLKQTDTGHGRQDDGGWAPNIATLNVTEKPAGAMNKNVDGRHVLGPLQGFGPLWQKTYLLSINKQGLQPHDVIAIMKSHFPAFQPPENKFYPTAKGIEAGEIVLIDSATPGGMVSTGVLVSYADDSSFTLMTPQGHPEAGWVTFSAEKRGEAVEMQIQGLARASDPLYEVAFRIAGSKLQESIWRHVLSSLAAHLEVAAEVQVAKTCVASELQWEKAENIWYNAQIRSLPYNIPLLFKRAPG